METIDEKTIAQWFHLFHNDGETVEIRVIETDKRIWSGYYRGFDNVLNAIKSVQKGGIYSPINPIFDALYSRAQCEKLILNAKETTNDKTITKRNWLLVDLDPVRPSGVNASDEEKSFAKQKMVEIGCFLRDQGFEPPVVADSSNGYHMYYRIDLPNDEASTSLMTETLQVLDMLFGDEKVDVDISVFNASRVAKVIGTRSGKGTDTKERPQRMSRFIKIPDDIKVTRREYISKIAQMLPKPEKPTKANNFNMERFDLDKFIADHNIDVEKRSKFKGGTKIILRECPFDSNHKAPDAAVFQMNDGSFGFRCLHNSCSHRSWRDFRLHFDPNAYDQKTYREFVSRQRYYAPFKFEPKKEDETIGKKWLSMKDIKWVDISSLFAMNTGFPALDKRIGGLIAGDITVLSGLSGAGKTSWLDSILLNIVDKGAKAAVWSGELQAFRFQSWLDQIAAGKAYVTKKDGDKEIYYVRKQVAEKIHNWLDDKLYLYNNDYGFEWKQIFSDLQEIVDKGVRLIVLDNLAALDISEEYTTKNEQQTKFVVDLKEFAKKNDIHIIIVCHPRKEMGFLRKESISGTADLTNLADNVLIIHRIGRDFEKRANEFFGNGTAAQYLGFDCVIEVAKNRAYGVVDYLVGMYYEKESRRLKNDIAENRIYGWQDTPVQSTMALKPQPLQYTPIEEEEETRNWWDDPIEPLYTTDQETPF